MGRFATFILGGIVGAAAGLLLAPNKGVETRETVKSMISDSLPECPPQAKAKAAELTAVVAKGSTAAINTVVDGAVDAKAAISERVQQAPIEVAAPTLADSNDELRAKIDAARERIATQVAKNAEALQDAAVDKIPAAVDAAGAAVNAVKEALPKVEVEVEVTKSDAPAEEAPEQKEAE